MFGEYQLTSADKNIFQVSILKLYDELSEKSKRISLEKIKKHLTNHQLKFNFRGKCIY